MNKKKLCLILLAVLMFGGLWYKSYCIEQKLNKLSTKIDLTLERTEDTINSVREEYNKVISQHKQTRVIFTNDEDTYSIDGDYKEYNEDEILSEILGFDINDIESANKDSWYYYKYLPDEQKRAYETILLSIIRQETCVIKDVPGITNENIHRFTKCISFDNERIFWIDFSGSSIKYLERTGEIFITGRAYEGLETIDKIYEAWNKIEKYKEKALKDTESFDDKELEKYIFNYINIHTEYNLDAYMNQSMYSAVCGETVCTGYAKLFKYLCNEAGIKCNCVEVETKEGRGHLLNMVWYDGHYYYTDSTAKLYINRSGDVFVSHEMVDLSSYDIDKYVDVNFMYGVFKEE